MYATWEILSLFLFFIYFFTPSGNAHNSLHLQVNICHFLETACVWDRQKKFPIAGLSVNPINTPCPVWYKLAL
jgi:hypothetical protein